MAPPPSYIPLIGNDNIVSVKSDDGSTDIVAGTINGLAVSGRSGSMKTSILLSMNFDESNGPKFFIEVACPASFSTPASNAAPFDYTQLLPIATASIVAEGLGPDPIWPANLDALVAGGGVTENYQLDGRLFAATPPSSAYPYGTLTFQFYGGSSDPIGGALVSATIDFGASVSN